jgi:hypothetical protein
MSPTELKMQPTIHLQSKPGDIANVLWVAFSIPSGSLSVITHEIHCMFHKILT